MRITILTAALNAVRTLPDCLASVAAQRLPEGVEVEHLVLDGGSTDGTIGLLERWRGEGGFGVSEFRNFGDQTGGLSGPDAGRRVGVSEGGGRRFRSRRDGGFYEALNAGLGEATGDIVGLLNADDFLYDTGVLARVADAFRDPAVQGVYGDLVYVRPDSRPGALEITRCWKAGEHHRHSFLRGWMPPHPTVYVRRAVYEASGGYRTDFGSAADYEWLLRVMVRDGTPFRYIPQRQVAMRAGGMSNRSLHARIAANRNDRRAWKVNGLRPHPWTPWLKPLRKLPQWIWGKAET